MDFEDRDIKGLLEVDGEEGFIRLAGSRAVVLDASALGVLRRELVEQAGLEEARSILTRVGFAQGWRLAGAREGAEEPAMEAAGLLGLFRVDSCTPSFLDGSLEGARSLFLDSYEAEQHVAHLGPCGVPVCWVISGLASGFLSRALGRDMVVREDRCAAMGHARCHFQGRPREEWEEGEAPCPVCPTPCEEATGLMARSPSMRRLVDLALRIARVDSTVLITGESGTGKELVARLVHQASRRSGGPFVAVNCGAIAEPLLESELFGHARGSFTGAVTERVGLFESAQGGTLLLDEVGEVSPGMQVKLLRVLQEREVRRVGESRSRPIDVRVLAATNADLALEIRSGRFRKDLFYRLNVVELQVPPLRERKEDILPLARRLLAQAAFRLKSPVAGLAPELEPQLLEYPWPGNVRELENAMERAVALADQARIQTLPEGIQSPAAARPWPVRSLAEVERDYILAVLDSNGGNQTRTAEQLRIGSATLYRKLKRYGRVHPRFLPLGTDPVRTPCG